MKSPSVPAVSRMLAVLLALTLLAGAFSLPAGAAPAGYAAEVVRLTNIERANDYRHALAATNAALNAAAQKRAEEIALKYEPPHYRPDGRKWSTVLSDYGISYMIAGENIAMGQKSPAAVVAAWMNSPGHRDNILGRKANFTYIGVGVCQKKDGRLCWVQLFLNDGTASANPGAGRSYPNNILGWLLTAWSYVAGLFTMIQSFIF